MCTGADLGSCWCKCAGFAEGRWGRGGGGECLVFIPGVVKEIIMEFYASIKGVEIYG